MSDDDSVEAMVRAVEEGGAVPDDAPGDLEVWARSAMAEIPVPLRPRPDQPLTRRRRALRFIAAEMARRRGDAAELEALLRDDWLTGGSAVPYIKLLLAVGRKEEAGIYGRLAAAHAKADSSEIDALLQDAADAADSWVAAVRAFVEDPSEDGWDDLMRFVPGDAFYERARFTLALLIRFGVDPDLVFWCATRDGVTPDAIGLAETGAASPNAIRKRAAHGSSLSIGLWLGLAAQSALARGDQFLAVRLLREAYEKHMSPFEPLSSAMWIREHADDELHAMLDSAGIPHFGEHGE